MANRLSFFLFGPGQVAPVTRESEDLPLPVRGRFRVWRSR